MPFKSIKVCCKKQTKQKKEDHNKKHYNKTPAGIGVYSYLLYDAQVWPS